MSNISILTLQTNAQTHKFIHFLTSNELTVQNTNVYNKVCPLNTTLVRIPRGRGVVILLTTRTAAAISFLQPPLKNSIDTSFRQYTISTAMMAAGRIRPRYRIFSQICFLFTKSYIKPYKLLHQRFLYHYFWYGGFVDKSGTGN